MRYLCSYSWKYFFCKAVGRAYRQNPSAIPLESFKNNIPDVSWLISLPKSFFRKTSVIECSFGRYRLNRIHSPTDNFLRFFLKINTFEWWPPIVFNKLWGLQLVTINLFRSRHIGCKRQKFFKNSCDKSIVFCVLVSLHSVLSNDFFFFFIHDSSGEIYITKSQDFSYFLWFIKKVS